MTLPYQVIINKLTFMKLSPRKFPKKPRASRASDKIKAITHNELLMINANESGSLIHAHLYFPQCGCGGIFNENLFPGIFTSQQISKAQLKH
jgi:hypothetical protein